jgi:hypothetical protein
MECLWMDWKIKKWSHECYVWGQRRMTIHGNKKGQHWSCKAHGSLILTSHYWWSGKSPANQSWLCLWNHPQQTWVPYSPCKMCPEITHNVAYTTHLDICQQHLDRYSNKHGAFLQRFITASQRVNSRVLNANIHNRRAGKSSKANHLQEDWCLQFLETYKAQYWKSIWKRHNSKWCSLRWDA